MADFVAQAIHKAAAPDEEWIDLDERERDDFRLVAHAAMGAHDAWLTMQGFAIVKRPPPKKGLITAERPKLIRPN